MNMQRAVPIRSPRTGVRALRACGFAVVAVAVAACVAFLPVDQWLIALVEWIRARGAVGVLAYATAYILSAVLLLPGSVMTLGAGFVYGPLFGALLVSPVSVVAATLAFLFGRSVARDWTARRVGSNPKFAAIDEAIGRSGFKIVVLLRLSPIVPFNLLNYALGLSSIRRRDFIVASWIGMFPGTFLYVYLGSLVTTGAELLSGRRPEAGPWGRILFVAGLVATLAVTVTVTRIARRALALALDHASPRHPEPPPPAPRSSNSQRAPSGAQSSYEDDDRAEPLRSQKDPDKTSRHLQDDLP